MAECWLRIISSHLLIHMALLSRGHLSPRDKLKMLDLLFHRTYGHQNFRDRSLGWRAPVYELIIPLDYKKHVENEKCHQIMLSTPNHAKYAKYLVPLALVLFRMKVSSWINMIKLESKILNKIFRDFFMFWFTFHSQQVLTEPCYYQEKVNVQVAS